MKYKIIITFLSCINICTSNYASSSYTAKANECAHYIENNPLHIAIGEKIPFEGILSNDSKSNIEAFRHFHRIMESFSDIIIKAIHAKSKDLSYEDYMQAEINIKNLQRSFDITAALSSIFPQLYEHEIKYINQYLVNLSEAIHYAGYQYRDRAHSYPVLPTPSTISQPISHTKRNSKPPSNIVSSTSSHQKQADNAHNTPIAISIDQRLAFIHKNKLSRLCTYQKLSSGYSERPISHSVENIMLLIRDPQILQTLQEKYRSASSADHAKVVKNLTQCRNKIAQKKNTENNVHEFDLFIQALTSSNRFALKKYLLIGSIITSGIIFVGYKLYSKYFNTPQSQSTTE